MSNGKTCSLAHEEGMRLVEQDDMRNKKTCRLVSKKTCLVCGAPRTAHRANLDSLDRGLRFVRGAQGPWETWLTKIYGI